MKYMGWSSCREGTILGLHGSGEVGAVVGSLIHDGAAEHKLNAQRVSLEDTGEGVAMDRFEKAKGKDEGMVVAPAGAGGHGRVEVDAAEGEQGVGGRFAVALDDPLVDPAGDDDIRFPIFGQREDNLVGCEAEGDGFGVELILVEEEGLSGQGARNGRLAVER